MFEMPVIEPQKCNGCGLCVSVCNCGALEIV
ncbi:MAG: ferredoxin, partial [Aliifodinibius sp.]|nr:ferredoxin [Fodinibius sp.]NIU12100.1 ferredoxin [Phycisphaerae bacterium]NIX00799.1 ferredoxin [Phycisphaerae bacterium]NIY27297.1 ferredoxin [Fodinibius sp.]